jgi:hydrogenase maturation protease
VVEVAVLGIGNVLWADEGFGVRAVEALHATYGFPETVELIDGGTQGLALGVYVESARRLLVLDAIDFGLAPGTLRVLRDAEVPSWSQAKLSAHQTGFNDLLALAALRGCAPERITVIGVQPVELNDFGGSLREPVRARIPDAVERAADELAAWGYAGRRRADGESVASLSAASIGLAVYEQGGLPQDDLSRFGDARLIVRRLAREGG